MRVIQDLSNANLVLSDDECAGQSLTLKGISDSTIHIQGTLGALYVYNCVNCTISVGFVRSACNIYKCKAVRLEAVCHQLRINESTDMDFKVCTKADPALVESSNAVFRRLELGEQHRRLLGDAFELFAQSHSWKNVQDFQSLNGAIQNFLINE